jgi:PAS domain S-box-containing protein
MAPTDDDSLIFRALLAASTDNIYVLDRRHRYTHVSNGGAAAIGLTPEEMIGKTGRELGLPFDLVEEASRLREHVLTTGETLRKRVTYPSAQGRRIFEYSMFPARDHVVVVSRDVTDSADAEEEVRRAAERYRSFVGNSSEGIWRFELEKPIDITLPVNEQLERFFADGYLAECNDAMARMYGYERAEEIVGARLPDLVPPDDPTNRDYLTGFVEAGYRMVDAESIEIDRHGEKKHFLNSLIAVIEDGKLYRAWGTQRDVTDQRNAAEQLRLSEQRLHALVSASAQMMWTTTPEGQVTTMSASWSEATGQPREEALGWGWLDCYHPDDRPPILSTWTAALEAKQPAQCDGRLQMRDRSYRWFTIRAVPLLEDDGSVREWVGSCDDIEAQKRQEAEVEAERTRAEFLASANDLFAQSLDYEQTLRSLAKLAVAGLSDWAAVDMREPDGTLRRIAVEHPDPEMVQLAHRLAERYPSDPNSPRGVYNILRTGRTEWMAEIGDDLLVASARDEEHLQLMRALRLRSFIGAPLRVGERIVGVLTLIKTDASRPFTARDAALAEQLAVRAGFAVENARLYQQALEANRAKDEFLATLSHELRTPLTAILGWANLLKLSNYDRDTLVTAVDTITRSATAQAALIDDILDVSRIVTGKFRLAVRAVDLVPIVASAVASARPAADAKKLTLTVSTPDSLILQADGNRLQQIIWNLISNAVKFTFDGGRIDVEAAREGEQAVIRVRDEGIGIQPDVLPRVFDRFWQADSSPNRAQGGLGLGLAIVKHLTELHGGTVRAESNGAGRGATFIIALPIVSGAAAAPSEPEVAKADARQARVLLVDDDENARIVIEKMLVHFGATVTSAATADEAVVAMERDEFDLVLTDLAMPEHDGYWLLAAARERNPSQRVVAITALGQPAEQIEGAGFDGCVRKPVEPAELAAALEKS